MLLSDFPKYSLSPHENSRIFCSNCMPTMLSDWFTVSILGLSHFCSDALTAVEHNIWNFFISGTWHLLFPIEIQCITINNHNPLEPFQTIHQFRHHMTYNKVKKRERAQLLHKENTIEFWIHNPYFHKEIIIFSFFILFVYENAIIVWVSLLFMLLCIPVWMLGNILKLLISSVDS